MSPEGAHELIPDLIPYRTEDAQTQIRIRRDGGSVRRAQAQMARPYQTTPHNVTLHLKGIFVEGEPDERATYKNQRQVRQA